ncbi:MULTISPECIES: group II intron reverse transcriptase/maturase [Cytobacillus]|uniref:Group II intron reverse transcriptase/maturase n=1 Tax=Cytobacillus firmus TaxID=1399 RepID=A0AA46P935_CYTFI|nr:MULTISPECIES: group II intron reverse transcriptase/maturase [Cytobacillus]MCM3245658.1 group II intron reverse transcriptase/maturase [Cytobacillus oceanisediminis]UYG98149.1 group II intron reverse transcriptase/maturase [Cytobacillus firmus]
MKVNRRLINSEDDLIKLLDDIHLKSKENGSFFGISEMLLNKEAIITAVHKVKSNKGSKTAGIDGKTIDDYLQMDEAELIATIQSHVVNYNPQPVRRIYIPKENIKTNDRTKMRPLGIPNMIDRIIQELVRMFIEPIAEARFYKHSYGFRPYRSAEHALARMRDVTRRSKTYWVIEGDIKGYFDNINHNKLLEIMWNMGIKDKRLLAIVKKMLRAGYIENGQYHKTTSGTPQGGIISPLLANIYLNGFDWLIAKEFEYHSYTDRYQSRRAAYQKLRKAGHEPTYLVRYADDWVILTTSESNARRLLKKAEKYLKHNLKLELSSEKTLITDIRRKPLTFLSYDMRIGMTREGKQAPLLYPNMRAVTKSTKEIKSLIKKLRYSPNDEWFATNIEKINEKLVGISNYFNKGISKRTLEKIDNRFFWGVWKSFKRYNLYKKDSTLADRHYVPLKSLGNRIARHEKYNGKTLAIEIDGIKIGITKCAITPVQYSRNFNQDITPYTSEGRKMYAKAMEKVLPLCRPATYKADELFIAHQNYNRILTNFEFVMNKDYAYNRDKGKCRACGCYLFGKSHCHHKNPKLPLNEVNKVANLISLCSNCHNLVHNNKIVEGAMKRIRLIEKLRKTIKS